MIRTSHRLDGVCQSPTIALNSKVRRLVAAGGDVISLAAGEPDFETPQGIKDAAVEALARGHTRYTDIAGTIELRKAVSRKFDAENGLTYAPEDITVGTGGKQVIFNAFMSTIDPGDEVVVPTPCWVSYPDIVALCSGVPILVEGARQNGYKVTDQQLYAAITAKTKWMVINNPCNPTGAVYSRAELEALCTVLVRHPSVLVLCDDIYEHFIYGDHAYVPLDRLCPELRDRIVTVNGCSKTYAMTGWRLGYAGGPSDIIRGMNLLQSQSTSNASSISQAAAVRALSGPQDSVAHMRNIYQRRRDLVVASLRNVELMDVFEPDGAFYVFCSIRKCLGKTSAGGTSIVDDVAFALALLDERGVAVVPGSAFMAPGHVRMSYAGDDRDLVDACKRIESFCGLLR